MLVREIEYPSVVPRLSDLEPEGRGSWPFEARGRLARAGQSWKRVGTSPRGQGVRGADLMSTGDVDVQTIILRPRSAGALTKR